MIAPSYKSLLEFVNGDEDLARELRKVLKGEIDPLSYPEVEKETRTWWHAPNTGSPYLILLVCNHLLELYGVEWIENKDHPEKSFYMLNTGDMYNETICYRPGKSVFLSCPGDIIEKWIE